CATNASLEMLPAQRPHDTRNEASFSDGRSRLTQAARADDTLRRSDMSDRSARSLMPVGQLADQLRSLGITVLAGLGQLDKDLVDAWVAASAHPGWQRIWDDPGAAARALLLRGEYPPTHEAIARRAAARVDTHPPDWSAVVAA